MSFRQVRNPHIKNRVVTTTMALVFVEAGCTVVVAVFPTLAIAIGAEVLPAVPGVGRKRHFHISTLFVPATEHFFATRRSYRIRITMVNAQAPGRGVTRLPLKLYPPENVIPSEIGVRFANDFGQAASHWRQEPMIFIQCRNQV